MGWMPQPKYKDLLNEYKNKTPYIWDPPQNRGHIQTEIEGLEKDIPHRDQKKQEKQCSYQIK